MQTIALIGSGYIGGALLCYWKRACRYKLIATTTSRDKLPILQQKAHAAHLVHGSDIQTLKAVLSEVDFVVVSVAPGKNATYEETYLQTAKNICKSISTASQLKHLIYLSSTSVYGDKDGAWVSEESPLSAQNENARTLIATESHYLEKGPTHTSILRLGGIYGPGRSHEERTRKLAGHIRAGNGDAYCNWVHQEDVVRSIDWVFTHSLTGIYNVCSTDHPRRQHLYDKFCKKLQLPPVQWDPDQVTTHSGNRRVSNAKLRDTGFEFLHSCSGPEKWLIPKQIEESTTY